MNLGDFLEGLGGGLVVNEAFAWSSRLAHKFVPIAVRLWTKDPDRRKVYLDDWRSVIDDCPGNLWRLAIAAHFIGGGIGRWAVRTTASTLARLPSLIPVWSRFNATAVLDLKPDSGGPATLPTVFERIYGVRLTHIGHGSNGGEIYRAAGGRRVESFVEGACGTSYWVVTRNRVGRRQPKQLILMAISNDTHAIRELRAYPWGLNEAGVELIALD